MHRRDKRCRRLKGHLWPEGRRGLVHIFSFEVPGADRSRTRQAPRRGRGPCPRAIFFFFFKEVRAHAEWPRQKRGRQRGFGGQSPRHLKQVKLREPKG